MGTDKDNLNIVKIIIIIILQKFNMYTNAERNEKTSVVFHRYNAYHEYKSV